MIELDIAGAQTIGTRAEQQDSAAMLRLSGERGKALLALADGVGGHADGGVAATMVTETFRERAAGGAFDVPARNRHALCDAIFEINQRMRAASDPADGERGLASTAVAAVVAEGRVRWISVGDSHLYLWRRGRLVKLNADHSQAGLMVRQGRSPDDPEVLVARSYLTSALTGYAIEEIDSPEHDVPLAIGDVLLLASDGLNTLADAEIAELVENCEKGAEAVANGLVNAVLARELPKQDNTTVIVAHVRGSGAPASSEDAVPHAAPSTARPERQRRGWHLVAGLVLLVVILASVIMTQMP